MSNERSTIQLDKLIGANIRKARGDMSMNRLGAVIGEQGHRINKYEQARSSISAARLYVIAKFFNMRMEEFCE